MVAREAVPSSRNAQMPPVPTAAAQLAPDVPTSLRCALEEWSSAVLGHWIFVGNLEVLLAPWDG